MPMTMLYAVALEMYMLSGIKNSTECRDFIVTILSIHYQNIIFSRTGRCLFIVLSSYWPTSHWSRFAIASLFE
jgi:hypothetical protein